MMINQSRFIADFIDFIKNLTDKPGLFQINDVEGVSLVIFGYRRGCAIDLIKYEQLGKFMDEFKEFVNKEFAISEDFDWPRLIRFYSNGNKNSIDLFRVKFEKF